jgi:hypothetical protein
LTLQNLDERIVVERTVKLRVLRQRIRRRTARADGRFLDP